MHIYIDIYIYILYTITWLVRELHSAEPGHEPSRGGAVSPAHGKHGDHSDDGDAQS